MRRSAGGSPSSIVKVESPIAQKDLRSRERHDNSDIESAEYVTTTMAVKAMSCQRRSRAID